MLIILASRYDAAARELADEWAAEEAAVLTCEDLSCEGWEYLVSDPRGGSVVVQGRRAPQSQVRAVLTRLPSVLPYDLPGIVDEDREYVAQELMAFLVAWLAALGSRVVNRPTPFCLMGPHWRPERWLQSARTLGLPTTPISRRVAPNEPPPAPATDVTSVTVVGSSAFLESGSSAPEPLAGHAIRLAQAAGAELLAVRFVGDAVVDAHLWPDLRVAEVRAALRRLLVRAGL